MSRMIPRSRTITCTTCHQPRFVEAGAELRALRRQAGLRLLDVATRANMSIAAVSKFERDQYIPPPALVAVYQSILEELDRTAS